MSKINILHVSIFYSLNFDKLINFKPLIKKTDNQKMMMF
jgi:hypothetical protein